MFSLSVEDICLLSTVLGSVSTHRKRHGRYYPYREQTEGLTAIKTFGRGYFLYKIHTESHFFT